MTIAIDLAHLHDAVKLISPNTDWSWLLTISKRIFATAPRKAGKYHLVMSDRLYLLDQNGLLHVWALDGPSEVDASATQARDLDWAIPVAEGGFTNLALRCDGAILGGQHK